MLGFQNGASSEMLSNDFSKLSAQAIAAKRMLRFVLQGVAILAENLQMSHSLATETRVALVMHMQLSSRLASATHLAEIPKSLDSFFAPRL